MKKLILRLIFVFFLGVPVFSAAQQLSETMFASPERDYGPMSWWHWINGNVTKQGIRHDLEAMHKAGIRGVQMFNVHIYLPKGPIVFASPEWVDMVKYAVETCDSLGMKFVAMNAAGWSGSGGPWITEDKAMKKMTFSEQKVDGGTVDVMLDRPVCVADYYRDVAIVAVPAQYKGGVIPNLDAKTLNANPSAGLTSLKEPALVAAAIPADKVLDITSFVDSQGHLKWNAPQGEWTVIRFGYTITGKKSHPTAHGGDGYECDKLNASHVRFQFDQSLGNLLKSTEKYLGNTFEGILFDSYESHWQDWTAQFPEEFQSLCGYDIRSYIPIFTGRYVGSAAESERVLHDFRCTLDHLISTCYYGTMQQLAHEHNIIVYAEGQGGPMNPGLVNRYIDVPMNEFWMPDTKPRITKIHLTASSADVAGKHIVAAEAFTAKPEDGKWQNVPWLMKKAGDLAFAGGITRYCLHTYAHQPYDNARPGFTMGRYGTMFNRHLTWWDYSGDWFSYITRSQYMLQQGEVVADVGFLFNDDIRYNFSSGMVTLPPGYDYRIIYPWDLEGAVCRDGYVVLKGGLKFSVLVLPDKPRMDAATLGRLRELVMEGATLSGAMPAGMFPQAEYSEKVQAAFDRTVGELWGGLDGKRVYTKKYGKGRIFSGRKTPEMLTLAGITPDISFGQASVADVMYHIHRRLNDGEFYFLTNQSDDPIKLSMDFRVSGKVPELWDPITGKTTVAPVYKVGNDVTTVEYPFDRHGSVFVVFRKPVTEDTKESNRPQPVETGQIVLDKDWTIVFADKRQKIDEPLESSGLFLWNDSPDERVKYYSGTAVYTNRFSVTSAQAKAAGSWILELGDLYDIASVSVNGKLIGTVWAKPFRIDITRAVKAGANELEIKVANRWINRVIGDEALPDDVRYETGGSKFTIGRIAEIPAWVREDRTPEDRQRITFATWKHYEASSPLVPSGLAGPVRIVSVTADTRHPGLSESRDGRRGGR